jgi:hypothetical protein
LELIQNGIFILERLKQELVRILQCGLMIKFFLTQIIKTIRLTMTYNRKPSTKIYILFWNLVLIQLWLMWNRLFLKHLCKCVNTLNWYQMCTETTRQMDDQMN